ncbi:MAG: sugar transferase [Chloroflexota bacterium]|nr:sugar transferase [Chloroflexota bacterium]MDE3192637.1 sugar transferase [Chloroflexota bacterium]
MNVIRTATAPGSAREQAPAFPLGKRCLDVLGALAGLVLLAPLLLALALAVVLDSGWPPLFPQTRLGSGGRPFRMWKLRTMAGDAEKRRDALLRRNEAPFPVFKLRDDPRVTRVGRVLRRLDVDELPQLWNVIRGEMSLVGPRPPLPEEVLRYDAIARGRLGGRPGITCIWQVESRLRSGISFEEWVRMDLEYLGRPWDLRTDLALILRTPLASARRSRRPGVNRDVPACVRSV